MERRWDVEDGDRGEGRWIFTREQLERVFAASADREKERRVRGATTEFIRRLGALLELHPSTVTAALLLWQRYFAVRTAIVSDRVHLAVAALLLATKIDSCKRSLNDVLALGMPMYHRSAKNTPPQQTQQLQSQQQQQQSQQTQKQHPQQQENTGMDVFTESEVSEERRKVRVAEYELLEFTGFDMHVQQPYETFVALAKGARVADDVAEGAWAVLCDVLATTDVPLRYTSAVVAAAVLQHALAAHAAAPAAAECTQRLQELCADLDGRKVRALCAEITALRAGPLPQPAAAPSSAPEGAPPPPESRQSRTSRSPRTRSHSQSRSRSRSYTRSQSPRGRSPSRYSQSPSRSHSSSRSPSPSRSRSRSRSRNRYYRRDHHYSGDDYEDDRRSHYHHRQAEDRRHPRGSERRGRRDEYDGSEESSSEYRGRHHSHHHHRHHSRSRHYHDDRYRREDSRDRSRSRNRDTDYDRRR